MLVSLLLRKTFLRGKNALEREFLTGFIGANNSGRETGKTGILKSLKGLSKIAFGIWGETAVKFFFTGNCSNKSCSSPGDTMEQKSNCRAARNTALKSGEEISGLQIAKPGASRYSSAPDLEIDRVWRWGVRTSGKWVLILCWLPLRVFRLRQKSQEWKRRERQDQSIDFQTSFSHVDGFLFRFVCSGSVRLDQQREFALFFEASFLRY